VAVEHFGREEYSEEAVKQLIIRGKRGKFSEFRTSEIASAGFLGIIQ